MPPQSFPKVSCCLCLCGTLMQKLAANCSQVLEKNQKLALKLQIVARIIHSAVQLTIDSLHSKWKYYISKSYLNILTVADFCIFTLPTFLASTVVVSEHVSVLSNCPRKLLAFLCKFQDNKRWHASWQEAYSGAREQKTTSCNFLFYIF